MINWIRILFFPSRNETIEYIGVILVHEKVGRLINKIWQHDTMGGFDFGVLDTTKIHNKFTVFPN